MTGLRQYIPKILIVCFIVSVSVNSFLWYQLESSKNKLDTAIDQLKTVSKEQTETIDWYSDLRDQINVRLGQGQNTRSFITPDGPLVEVLTSVTLQILIHPYFPELTMTPWNGDQTSGGCLPKH